MGQNLVWDYIRENWPKLQERYGVNSYILGYLIPWSTSRFATQTKLLEMETFFAQNPEAGAGAPLRESAINAVKYKKVGWNIICQKWLIG